jgi:hypothetical protein
VIVCYARGGGLGHLTRVRAYLHTVHPGAPATIRTGWPADLAELEPEEIVLDAFPAGLDGEVGAALVPAGVRVVHLARLLRWDAYRPLIPADPVRFDRTWLVEPVTEPHLAYLRSVSATVAPLKLCDPAAGPLEPSASPVGPLKLSGSPVVQPKFSAPPAGPLKLSGSAAMAPPGGLAAVSGDWLIVHAGPADEVMELVAYARETAALEGAAPRFVLVSPTAPPGLPADVAHLDARPAWPLFAGAARIVSAAGFNTVRQAAPYREKHRMLPFPRRYDDQFARAVAARA